MRIAIAQRLTLAHGIRGGMEIQSHILAESLQQRGHDIVILTTPHPDGIAEGMEGTLPVRYIGPGTYRRYDPRWWDACYDTLATQHTTQPFDVLLSQSAGALAYLPRAVADLRLPAVVIIHGSMLGELRTRWRGVWSPRGVYRMLRFLMVQPHLFLLWRKAVPFVAHWVAVSQETAREWQKEQRIIPSRMTVVPNGIDTTLFCPNAHTRQAVRSKLNIPLDAPLLIAVGRLEEEKGFHLAVQGIQYLRSRFPTMHLLIVGEGIYRKSLEHMAASLKERIHILGYVPNDQVPELLAAADLFLMPTLRDEGFPMTIPEAMACGLPVVASRVGGVPSAVDEGTTGLMVPMGDVAALAQAIERLLCDQSLRASFAAAARHTAVTRFSREHMAEATEQVLRKATNRR